MTLPPAFFGVDIAKDKLDVFDPSTFRHEWQSTNDLSLLRFTTGHVLETSGGCEPLITMALTQARQLSAYVNLHQAREFVHAVVRQVRSNRVDANTHADMGTSIQVSPAPPRSMKRPQLSELVARREDATCIIAAEQNRLRIGRRAVDLPDIKDAPPGSEEKPCRNRR